jgi:hypothetical protein
MATAFLVAFAFFVVLPSFRDFEGLARVMVVLIVGLAVLAGAYAKSSEK